VHIVLRQYHVMAGCDFHNEVTAVIPPVSAPMIPHVVGHVMQGWGITPTAIMTDTKVQALGTNVMQRDTDIGNGIIHVPIPPYPPCALLPVIIPFSGSKSYFGPSSVVAASAVAGAGGGDAKPIAGAVLIVVNLNLNCADPCAMPLNVVIAWGNVVCGMTVGDILGGIIGMGIDAAITFAFNKLGGWVGGKLLGKVTNVFFNKAAEALISQVIQQLTGSPLGYTNAPLHYLLGDNASVGNWGAALGHAAGDKIDQLLSDAPPAQTSQSLSSPPPSPPPSSPATHGIVNDAGVEDL
jgi:hypothetical protein